MKKELTQAEHQYKVIIAALQVASSGGDQHSKRKLARISRETGFSSKWLSLMAAGAIDDAGFKKVTRLSTWLSTHGYLNPNNNKQPAAILAPQADSCEPHTGADAGEAFLICSTENNRAEMDCSALQDTDDFMGTGNERFPIR